MTFEDVYVNPKGRTARGPFLAALAVLLAVTALFVVMVANRTGLWCLVVLIFPAVVLHARRLHDMGQSAWLLVAPAGLLLAAAGLNLYAADSALTTPAQWASLAVAAGFAIWGALGKGQAEVNRFGAPAAA